MVVHGLKKTGVPLPRQTLLRIFGIVLFTTALGGLIFQSTTFALPKAFDERLTDIAGTATLVGTYGFAMLFSVLSVAAFAIFLGTLLLPGKTHAINARVAG